MTQLILFHIDLLRKASLQDLEDLAEQFDQNTHRQHDPRQCRLIVLDKLVFARTAEQSESPAESNSFFEVGKYSLCNWCSEYATVQSKLHC